MKKNLLNSLILICVMNISFAFTFAAEVKDKVAALKDSLEILAGRTEHDILEIHFSSLLQVINSKKDLTSLDSSLIGGVYDSFFTGTTCKLTELSTYTSGCKSLIVSWISPTDEEISYTWLDLPGDWKIDSVYPLYVYLHGLWDVAGDKMRYLTYPYTTQGDLSEVVAFDDGYLLSPWGRGNLWYQGISETDIWECIAKIEELFNIDRNRKYIGGHSMGGFGSWYISSKSPDVWAGVGVHAGAIANYNGFAPKNFFALRNKPVYFVCGDADGFLQASINAHGILQQTGNENLKLVTFPGGHEYRQQDVDGFYLWVRNFTKQIDTGLNYLGLETPTDSSVVFAPGVISVTGRNEYAPRFSSDGSDFYYTTEQNNRSSLTTYYLHYEDSVLSEEDTAFFSKLYENSGEPWLLNDSTIYFTRNTGTSDNITTDFWKAEKNEAGEWQEPKSLGSPVNNITQQWHIAVTKRNTIAFSSNGEVYISNPDGPNTHSYPIVIQHPARSNDMNADVFVNPYENYIIYSAETPEDIGNKDLYIVFNNYGLLGGDLTYPKKLNSSVNSSDDEFAPYVTPDGKYLFFSRKKGDETDIFWISSDFIDSLRRTNFIPYKMYSLTDQVGTVGKSFSYSFPDSVFIDDNGLQSLTFEIKQSNGDGLPEGLSFNSNYQRINGRPTVPGVYNMKVTVTDEEGYVLSDEFTLTINEASDIGELTTDLLHIYPNPVKTSLFINYDMKNSPYEIIGLEGNIVKKGYFVNNSINISDLENGIYILKIHFEKDAFILKVVKD